MTDPRTAASWRLAPHTGAKLAILGAYLRAWFPILGRGGFPRVLYIDGFAGPGRYAGGEDGSPIVALKALGSQENLDDTAFEFHFVERKRRAVMALKANIAELRSNGGIAANAQVFVHENQTFEQAYREKIKPRLLQSLRAPAFALVDPFGWTGLPMAIMSELMSRPSTEVLVNFMFEEINRFLGHYQQGGNFDDLFATNAWRQAGSLSGVERKAYVHNLYRDQLIKAAGARYVRTFEMLNDRGASDYFLYFATKNFLGLSKMKEAMWKVDPGGGNRFSDMTNLDQFVLLQPEPDLHVLQRQLLQRFSASIVSVNEIERFVVEETAFHAGHFKKVLLNMESSGKLVVVDPVAQRRRGTFRDGAMRLRFS